jgi:hypothetical protein
VEFYFGKSPQDNIILSLWKLRQLSPSLFLWRFGDTYAYDGCRLYGLGNSVNSIKSDSKTILNKRVVMAVDKRLVFPSGRAMNFEIESDAPKHVFDLVQLEALKLSPAFMAWNSRGIHN